MYKVLINNVDKDTYQLLQLLVNSGTSEKNKSFIMEMRHMPLSRQQKIKKILNDLLKENMLNIRNILDQIRTLEDEAGSTTEKMTIQRQGCSNWIS